MTYKIYGKCPECGKIVTAKIPKLGDGSAWYPYPHGNPKTNKKCNGCYILVDKLENNYDIMAKDFFVVSKTGKRT